MRNDLMPTHMLELSEKAAKELQLDITSLKIAILGASFIENSEDTRNSPTESFVKLLEEKGIQWVIHDPFVRPQEFPYPVSKNLEEVVQGTDILIVFVKHKEYHSITPQWLKEKMNHLIIIDGRDIFNLTEFRENGFVAYGIGKPLK